MVTRSFLVIETKAGAALLVSDRLAQFNSNVCALAVSGRQAIGLAARRRPGQAMVDVRLKGDLDGPDTARALGAQLDNPSILLSGVPRRCTRPAAKAWHRSPSSRSPTRPHSSNRSWRAASYRDSGRIPATFQPHQEEMKGTPI
jgi:hypothetical protein